MLRACRRVLKPGGRIAFYTIAIAPGLSPAAYRRALRVRPDAAASRRRDQPTLLRDAGFAGVTEADVTAEFLAVARALLAGRRRHAAELSRALGEAECAALLEESKEGVEAIGDGLFSRLLLIGRRPN